MIAGDSHVYVVEVVGVCSKLGISRDPTRRLAQHSAAAAAMGREIGRVFMTPPHADALEIETIVKAAAATEYLREPFESVVDRLHVAISFLDSKGRRRRSRRTDDWMRGLSKVTWSGMPETCPFCERTPLTAYARLDEIQASGRVETGCCRSTVPLNRLRHA